MSTRQEVVDAYRYILGREPENEAAIANHLVAKSLAELRVRFLRSAEFQKNAAGVDGVRAFEAESLLPKLELPPSRVDTEATPQQMQTLLDRIKAEWEGFGRDEPHWSVLTHDSFKRDSLAKNKDQFFESASYIKTLIQAFGARNGLSPSSYPTCFELGCGVGRITLQLAGMFRHVIGADISKFHLDVCEEELRRNKFANCELMCLSDIAQLRSMRSFDFFCSLIVLQHNPPPVMKLLLEVILGKLNPGGIGMFQLPTYISPYEFDLKKYLSHPTPLHMEMHVLPQPVVFEAIAAANCQVMEVREDSFVSPRRPDMLSNTFFVRKR